MSSENMIELTEIHRRFERLEIQYQEQLKLNKKLLSQLDRVELKSIDNSGRQKVKKKKIIT